MDTAQACKAKRTRVKPTKKVKIDTSVVPRTPPITFILVDGKKKRIRCNKKGTPEHDALLVRRAELLKESMLSKYDHPAPGLFYQHQPIKTQFAVCAVVCAAHIVGTTLSIYKNSANDGRHLFESIAKTIPNSHNADGHYHISVLDRFLKQYHKVRFEKIVLGGTVLADRQQALLTYIYSINVPTTFFFMGTIVLTLKHLDVAPHHFIVIKVLGGEQPPVLLDGLFSGPKVFCIEVLRRYTEINGLYIVVPM
jgi:hypothetical protein